jgi:S-adenosylmethionine synthetase
MIGYACRENSNWIPQEYNLARELNKMIFKYHPYDGKTQVTILPNEKSKSCCIIL